MTIEFPRSLTRDRAAGRFVEEATGIPAETITVDGIRMESGIVDGQVVMRIEIIPFVLTPDQAAELLSLMTGANVVVDDHE